MALHRRITGASSSTRRFLLKQAAWLLGVIALGFATAGCGGGGGSSRPAPDISAFLGTYSGNWYETVGSGVAGDEAGTITMVVAKNDSGYPSISGTITDTTLGASGTFSDKNCTVTRSGGTVIFLDFHFPAALQNNSTAVSVKLNWKGYLLNEVPGVLANEVNVDPTGEGQPSSIADKQNSSSPVYVSLTAQQ